MKKIPVRNKSQNLEAWALVDDADYAILSKRSWCLRHGRAVTSVAGGKRMEMMYMIMPKRKGFVIDHKDRNPLNNQRDNLRYATVQQNIWNSERLYPGKTYVGVSNVYNGYFAASITNSGITENLGIFDSEEFAARVRDLRCFEVRGEFAVLNLPDLPLLTSQDIEARRLNTRDIRHIIKRLNGNFAGVSKKTSKGGEVFYKADADTPDKRISLGSYKTAEIAARVRDSVVLYYMGELAYTNFDDIEPLTPDEAKRAFREHRYLGNKNQTRYKGVVNNNKYWQAQIVIAGKPKYIGSYKTPELAAKAYDYCARRRLGENAFLNFPNVDEDPPRVRRPRNKKSKYKGVYPTRSRKNPWYAMIGTTGKVFYIGRYKTEEQAAKAYDEKAVEMLGARAELNFPPISAIKLSKNA